jgi:hypothetical protein
MKKIYFCSKMIQNALEFDFIIGNIMRFTLVHKGKVVSSPLLEAEQDGKWVLLSDNPKGLISCGQYNCYALIVKYGHQVAMAHVSTADDTCEFLNDMICGVSASDHKDVSVSLARSFTGYTASQEEDIQDCQRLNVPFEGDDAETYFKAMDEEYTQLFKKDFKSITPTFLTMPHDFLVIDAHGDIKLYEEYGVHEISYLKYKKIASSSLSTSLSNASSPQVFFNSSQASVLLSGVAVQASHAPNKVAEEEQETSLKLEFRS